MKAQTTKVSAMQVPTCQDCHWQFIPDGEVQPTSCPECDCYDFEACAERTDSEMVVFTIGVLKAMLATVPAHQWEENAVMVTTILRAMKAVRG